MPRVLHLHVEEIIERVLNIQHHVAKAGAHRALARRREADDPEVVHRLVALLKQHVPREGEEAAVGIALE